MCSPALYASSTRTELAGVVQSSLARDACPVSGGALQSFRVWGVVYIAVSLANMENVNRGGVRRKAGGGRWRRSGKGG